MEHLYHLLLALKFTSRSRHLSLNGSDKPFLGHLGDDTKLITRKEVGEGERGELIQRSSTSSRLMANSLRQGIAVVPHVNQLLTKEKRR